MLQLSGYDGKKGDILKASLNLFAGRGYDAVSVRDIAKEAGVSEAALYKHFKGKEEMARYIFSVIISDYTARLKMIDAEPEDAVGKLCRIVDVTYELYQQYPAEIRFTLLSQYLFWDSVAEELKPHFIFRKILAAGMELGEIPKQEVYFWITVYSGIMLQPLAQYHYFADVLPGFEEMRLKVKILVRKLFS